MAPPIPPSEFEKQWQTTLNSLKKDKILQFFEDYHDDFSKLKKEDQVRLMNLRGLDNNTALASAVQLPTLEVAQAMVNLGADVNKATNGPDSLFAYAAGKEFTYVAGNDNIKLLEFLLQNDGDATSLTSNFRTRLPSLGAHPELVQKLLEKGAHERALEYTPPPPSVEPSPLDEPIISDPKIIANMKLWAATGGHVGVMKILLERDNERIAPLNQEKLTKENGGTPPPESILRNLKDQQITDQQQKSENDWDAIVAAVKHGNVDVLKLLLNDKNTRANLNEAIEPGNALFPPETLLRLAAKSGNAEIIKLLIEKGANIDNIHAFGSELLRVAIVAENVSLIEILVQKGVSPNALNKNKHTPLYEAVQGGSGKIVQLLIDKGANVDEEDPIKLTALHRAADWGKVDAAKVLINNGANVDAVDFQGETPLHLAINNKNVDIVRLLIDHGSNINAMNNNHETPLHLAASYGEIEIAKMLLAKDANPNTADKSSGFTPLHEAAKTGNIEIIKLLIAKGAKIDASDLFGRTPMDVATKFNHEDVIKILKEKAEENCASYQMPNGEKMELPDLAQLGVRPAASLASRPYAVAASKPIVYTTPL